MQRLISPSFPRSLGRFDPRQTPVLPTDVLVIGAGIAGAAAALEAADSGASVLCVSKTPLEESNTHYAQGGLAAALSDQDSVDLHLQDTLTVGAGLASEQVARFIVERGPEAVAWLTDLGAQFDRGHDGALLLGREGGHSVNRVVHANGDSTGAEIERVLARALDRHGGITVKVGAFVRDLLVEDERCVGAVILTDGVQLAVQAGAVVVAAGGSGQVYRETTNPIGACGDGPALAYRAGAELADMEFFQFHPTTLYIAGASRFLISEAVRGAGATLRDRNGVRFMQDVHPQAELAPRDVVSRAILDQMVRTQDTHVYLDLTHLEVDPHRRFPSISKICRAFDIDIAEDPIPVRPGAHFLIGGIHADRQGRSSLPGLFAVGEAAATSFHGANRLASNSLLEGAVLGRETGRTAAAESRLVALPRRESPETPVGDAPQLQLDDMLYSLKSLMWRQVGLLRTRKGLEEATHRIGLWSHYLMHAHLQSRQAFQLTNMLNLSALIACAAVCREESRGTHFRTDHPDRQDEPWCRHVFLRRRADGTIGTRIGEHTLPTDSPD